jgi:glycosyltransferase involved in cell wall biosynthesis
MYRGDKDFRLGIELCKDPDIKYSVLVPDVASPGDRKFFATEHFPRNQVPKLPANMEIHFLKSRLVYFSKQNLSLGGFFQFSRQYQGFIKKLKPDLIFENPYTTLTPRSYQTYFAAKANGIPMVYVDPGDIPPKGALKRMMARFETPIVNNAKHVIVYNEMGRARFIRDYGYPEDRISVIPKPVDTAQFTPGKGREEARAKLGAGDRFVVGYMGRLSNNKGGIHLMNVARQFKEEGISSRFLFAFVGGSITEADAEPFHAIKKKYGLDNVHLTGKVPHSDMTAYQAACDLIIYPDVTNLPGFSTVLAESMAMGKAIVMGIQGFEGATPIKDGVNGRIVQAGNEKEIGDAIKELENDPGQIRKYGDAVRKFAVEGMDWKAQAKIYKEVFERAVEI